MEVFWGFRICPENGIMEWWNDGILVFKSILAILILSSISAGGGTINPILHYPRTHYSTIP
jgi:hypothetical protein